MPIKQFFFSSSKKKTRTAPSQPTRVQVDQLTPKRFRALVDDELQRCTQEPVTHPDPATIDTERLLSQAWEKRKRQIHWATNVVIGGIIKDIQAKDNKV